MSHVEQLRRDGYVILERVLDADGVAAITAALAPYVVDDAYRDHKTHDHAIADRLLARPQAGFDPTRS